eukprot:m.175162 g.175162  ORF g.175162 m.175162 type:complete len:61 (-) comp24396_c0_seq1:39-221(-)
MTATVKYSKCDVMSVGHHSDVPHKLRDSSDCEPTPTPATCEYALAQIYTDPATQPTLSLS